MQTEAGKQSYPCFTTHKAQTDKYLIPKKLKGCHLINLLKLGSLRNGWIKIIRKIRPKNLPNSPEGGQGRCLTLMAVAPLTCPLPSHQIWKGVGRKRTLYCPRTSAQLACSCVQIAIVLSTHSSIRTYCPFTHQFTFLDLVRSWASVIGSLGPTLGLCSLPPPWGLTELWHLGLTLQRCLQ